jgi:hypothetical protein
MVAVIAMISFALFPFSMTVMPGVRRLGSVVVRQLVGDGRLLP